MGGPTWKVSGTGERSLAHPRTSPTPDARGAGDGPRRAGSEKPVHCPYGACGRRAGAREVLGGPGMRASRPEGRRLAWDSLRAWRVGEADVGHQITPARTERTRRRRGGERGPGYRPPPQCTRRAPCGPGRPSDGRGRVAPSPRAHDASDEAPDHLPGPRSRVGAPTFQTSRPYPLTQEAKFSTERCASLPSCTKNLD